MNLLDLIKETNFTIHRNGGDEHTFKFDNYNDATEFSKQIHYCENNNQYSLKYTDQQGKNVGLRFESYVESNEFRTLIEQQNLIKRGENFTMVKA